MGTNKQAKMSPSERLDQLTPEQRHITQEKGTERPFTGKYVDHKDDGMYTCVVCGEPLFDSNAKFESGSGWPSFHEPANVESVSTNEDSSLGMMRTEVTCRSCGAHLGHVFTDGPRPTGLRYCINSGSLDFEASPTESRAPDGASD